MESVAKLTPKGIEAVNSYFYSGEKPKHLTDIELNTLVGIGESNSEYLSTLPQDAMQRAAKKLLDRDYIFVQKVSWFQG